MKACTWEFFKNLCQSSYFVENLLAPASVKRNSTAHIISGIFQNFKDTEGWRLCFLCLKCTKKELHYKELYFIFKMPVRNFVSLIFSSVPVDYKLAPLVKRVFLKIFRRTTFRNINAHDRVFDRFVECRNFAC